MDKPPEERMIYCAFESKRRMEWIERHKEGYLPEEMLEPITIIGRERMPDIFAFDYYWDLIVSNRFRLALDALAPGQAEFLPMQVSIPAHMEPDEFVLLPQYREPAELRRLGLAEFYRACEFL